MSQAVYGLTAFISTRARNAGRWRRPNVHEIRERLPNLNWVDDSGTLHHGVDAELERDDAIRDVCVRDNLIRHKRNLSAVERRVDPDLRAA